MRLPGYSLEPLGASRIALILTGLAVASFYDVRERSVPAALMLGLLGIELVLLAADVIMNGLPQFWVAYLTADLLSLIAFAALTLLCLIGLGDLVAYAAIAAAWPWGWSLLPLPITTLLYYALVSLALSIYNIAANLADPVARRLLAREPLGRRIYLLFTARPIPVKRILRGSWWIPLIEEGGRRVICSTDVEPRDIIIDALRKERLRENDVVWATWGMPALPLMLIGLVLALIVGDKPILYLLHARI